VSVYFVRGEALAPVERVASGRASLAEFVVRELLAGPTPEEAAAGLATAIPDGAEVLAVAVDGSTASVNLSKEFELSAEQRILVLRLGQVVYTVTDLARVTNVRFLIDGEPAAVVGQDGEAHDVVTRSDYAMLAPLEPMPPPPQDAAA
jgi:spore germination protein GerM